MPILTRQPLRLIDAQQRDLGRLTISPREGDLYSGTFVPGPDFADVQPLFQAFEEAVELQALRHIEDLDVLIAALGLRLQSPDDARGFALRDVQIWSDGRLTFRLADAASSSLEGGQAIASAQNASNERRVGDQSSCRAPSAPSRRSNPRVEPMEDRKMLAFDAQQSALAGIDHLAQVMDQYHDRFIVYEDVSAAGNHFHAFCLIPDENAAATLNGSWPLEPRSGATSIRNEFRDTMEPNYGGFYFQNGVLTGQDRAPRCNFGTEPGAGVDLTGATVLTFWARGERGGEQIEFFMGGVGRNAETGVPTEPFPDSTSVVKITVSLTTQWTQYRIDLSGRDLSYVLGGFGWAASDLANPGGAVFYLDDIQYELDAGRRMQRLNEPRFLRSFTTRPVQPDPFDANKDDDIDFVLRNAANTYDNALAILAFLADGSPDSLRRARLIGDAFVYASAHDRTYDDGRLRSFFAAGDISLPPGWLPNGRAGTTPVPGFYVDSLQQFFELEEKPAVDTGNNAWTMIAMLALHSQTGDPAYLATARRLGEFIQTFRNDIGTYRGFQGGLEDPEGPMPTRRPWASTEHNLDVFAAFTRMFEVTGEPQWRDGAEHARAFVEAMFDSARNCFLTGTIDPETLNTTPGQLPLDAQAWAVLALPNALTTHPRALNCAEANHRVTAGGYTGYDFNEDRDGVWFEGTGQMTVAYAHTGQPARVSALRATLRRGQQSSLGDGRGLVATPGEILTTGFGFKYFHRLHVGATAWNVFAQLGFNPYHQTVVSAPFAIAGDYDSDDSADLAVYRPSTAQWFLSPSSDGPRSQPFGAAVSDVPIPADYDGDGVTDLTVFRPSTAQWFILQSSAGPRAQPFGAANLDIPVPADYDGDGRTDLAVFRPTTAEWFILRSTAGPLASPFGAANLDQPVPADYDGDGKVDLAVFRPTTAEWFLVQSTAGPRFQPFGAGNLDRPVPADYDGDGKTDIAVFRPTTAEFFLLQSTAGPRFQPFGQANVDIPVPADYDGDGRSDVAVFRPTTAEFFILQSTVGPRAQPFGGGNLDVPIVTPLAYRYPGGLARSFAVSPRGQRSRSSTVEARTEILVPLPEAHETLVSRTVERRHRRRGLAIFTRL